MRTISFNTIGHDGFIDFIKAYAIICVLFGHTFLWLDKVVYYAWAGMQVPLFILVQSFHFYKKENSTFSINKVFRRVLLPFFIVEAITLLIALILGEDCNKLTSSVLIGGGYGAGTYYPWVYLQIAALLPLTMILFKNIKKQGLLLITLIVCEFFEILCSIINLSDWIYRLLAIRYFFLLYLGWLWVKEGIRINTLSLFIAFISLASIVFFEYYKTNNEPWFFDTSWATHRWPCYFWISYGLVPILYIIWQRIGNNRIIAKIISLLSSSSYEIFLMQMSFIVLIRYNNVRTIIGDKFFGYLIWALMIWTLSLSTGILLHHLLNRNKRIEYSGIKRR